MNTTTEEKKQRIVILGAGESGAGAAVLAKVKGLDTFVSDQGRIKDKYKALLDRYGIEWEEGGHTEAKILNADEVVKSPGIPNDAPLIVKLRAQGTLRNLQGVLYFTDGKGIYPSRRPPYDVAFLFLDTGEPVPDVPPWAMRLMLEPDEFIAPQAPKLPDFDFAADPEDLPQL